MTAVNVMNGFFVHLCPKTRNDSKTSCGPPPAKNDGWSEDDEMESNQYAIGSFQKPPNQTPGGAVEGEGGNTL